VRPLWPTLLTLLILIPTAAAVETTHKVFQSDSTVGGAFLYDVNQVQPDANHVDNQPWFSASPGARNCPGGDTKPCLKSVHENDERDLLGKSLAAKTHYNVSYEIYADADHSGSGFQASFSFENTPATTSTAGDGWNNGAFRNSLNARYHETTTGWDLAISEVTNGVYQDIASTSDNSDSSQWHAYSFDVDSVADRATVYGGSGEVLLTAQIAHHHGGAMRSQWFVARSYSSGGAGGILIRDIGTSTAIVDEDPQPPTVSNLKQVPGSVAPGQSVTVTATVADDWGQPASVIQWSVNGVAKSDITMAYQSTTGARALIPAQQSDAVVRYQIVATDGTQLQAASDQWQYTVGSGQGATNIGGAFSGGSGGHVAQDAGSALDGVLFGGTIVLLAFFAFLLLRGSNPKLASISLIVGLLGGILVAVYITNQAAIQSFFTDNSLAVYVVAGAIIVLVVLIGIRVAMNRSTGGPQ
jgi:hypothetical protein